MTNRPSGRKADELREITITNKASPYAEGSCFIECGNTHVLCTASVEERVPPFLRGKGKGWVTAEYGMLPRSTHTRMNREASKGKQSGRTVEIQRLIGRSLRAIIDLEILGERQILIDCDVIQADGGTRTASITGAYVALAIACNKLVADGVLKTSPITAQLAAVSCGLYNGTPVLDLEYVEDSAAQADANFVLTSDGGIIEVQATAEEYVMSNDEFNALFDLARKGVAELAVLQQDVLNDDQ